MIVRCFLLVILIILDELSVVRCDNSSASAFEESSVYIKVDISNEAITASNSDFVTTASANEETEVSTSDPCRTKIRNTRNNHPKEYSPVTSGFMKNSTTEHEELMVKESFSTFEETTPTTTELELPTVTEKNSTQVQEQVEDLPPSKLFKTLVNLEEAYNMTFNKLVSLFMKESKESNLDKKRRRKEKKQAVDTSAGFEDASVETEFVKQEVKHKSLGIEPLALIVIPEVHTRGLFKATTPIFSSRDTQYEKTSFQLPVDIAVDEAPFVVKSKSPKKVKLQGDLSNITHEANSLKKSPENAIYLSQPLTVELQEDSVLLMNANERQELAFEVTNNLNNAARVTFTVRDELGILLEIDRYIAILGPHSSTTVRVAVLPKSGQSSDRITFIATGSEQVRKEVIVDIEGNFRYDTDHPIVDYDYLSDCTDIVFSKCKEGAWSIKIAAKDDESGLKLLTTIPKGLYIPDGYTAGTKEEVSGIYSESCCNADLQIIAIDRMNNKYFRQINAYRAPLNFWAVTAITLVSLIFLTIIVGSSLICLNKCKKNEAASFDLPTYRGGRSRY